MNSGYCVICGEPIPLDGGSVCYECEDAQEKEYEELKPGVYGDVGEVL